MTDDVTVADIIGFSAVRASGFSRVGESRIFFENTVRNLFTF